MELVIVFVFVFVIGMVIGCVFSSIVRRSKSVGKLRIDTSDPDGPFMFLELSKGVGDISTKKQVLLQVDLKSYISHE